MKYFYRLCSYITFLFATQNTFAQIELSSIHEPNSEAIYFGDSLVFNQSDSLIRSYQTSFSKNLTTGDTLLAIGILNDLSGIYTNRVNYVKSYDGYWQALLLAEKIGAEKEKADSYNGLGILYSLYERKEEALKYYLRALQLNKKLVVEKKLDSLGLRESYFPLAVHFKYEGELELAHAYLDSCEMIKSPNVSNTLLPKAERAHIQVLEGNYLQAKATFDSIENDIIQYHPGFLIIFYNYIGDLNYLSGKLAASENSYKAAIKSAFSHQSHLNYIPDIYEKLAIVFEKSGNDTEANRYLKLANSINRSLYSSRSPNNRYLLDIKDEFRLQQERAKQDAQEQHLLNLQQSNEISQLQNTLLIICICFILSLGYFLFKYWKTKHKLEKRELEKQRKLEAENAKEILLVKNQELTGTTLKIIAKDELLNEVKEKLKKLETKPDPIDLRRLVKAIDVNKDQSWLDFETQFLALNDSFYDNVRKIHPDLKPYDLKICALIKLDFSGKEMARLLGISAESANTSRYRLRKKLGLQKEDNLVEYIMKIGSS